MSTAAGEEKPTLGPPTLGDFVRDDARHRYARAAGLVMIFFALLLVAFMVAIFFDKAAALPILGDLLKVVVFGGMGLAAGIAAVNKSG